MTITGSGDSTDCYAIINGTKQYRAGTHEVNTRDTITFVLISSVLPSTLTIDGTEVLRATIGQTLTYDWTVPSGISTVEIAMKYAVVNGRITVTTA